MGKATDRILAKNIANRIDEILQKTGMTVAGLAAFTKIGASSLRSYQRGSLPISVETVFKICTPLAIPLTDFFDFHQPLDIAIDELTKFQTFRSQSLSASSGYFQEEKKHFVSKPTSTGRKRERDYIAYIIFHTDYFATPRTVAQMLTDFAHEHDLHLESGRLYELLKKYVGTALKRRPVLRVKNDESTSKRTIFLYSKA